MARITIQGEGDRLRPTTTSIPRAGQVGPITGGGKGLQDLSNALIGITAESIEKRNRAIDVDYIADSNVKANSMIQELRNNMIENMEDPKGFSEKFIAEADKIYDSFVIDAPSEASKNSLKTAFSGQRINQFRSAFDLENQTIAQDVLANATENVNIIANSIHDNPSSLQAGIELLQPVIESADEILSEVNKEKFQKQAERNIANSFVTGLINNNSLEDANNAIDSEEAKRLLTPDERDSLRGAVRAKASLSLKRFKDQREEQVKIINDGFLLREREGKLNVSDVMSSKLDPLGDRSKDLWYKRLDKAEISAVGNARIYNRVYDDVENLTEDEIFSLADPDNIGVNGRPLNMKQVESLLKAKRGDTEDVLKNYFAGVKASVTGSNSIFMRDPEGDQQFFKLKSSAEQMVKNSKIKGTKEFGLTSRDMFDPLSPRFPEFGGTLLSENKRSPQQIMESSVNALRTEAGEEKPKKPLRERFSSFFNSNKNVNE